MAFLEVLELGCRRCKKDVWCKAPLQIVGVNVIYDILVLYCTSGLEIYFFFIWKFVTFLVFFWLLSGQMG